MLHSIENQFIKLTVNDEGGSMHSLIYKPTGEERLWQGGEAWASRDVVIFPIIGHAGPFEVCGKSYQLKSHGLARYTRLAKKMARSNLRSAFLPTRRAKRAIPSTLIFPLHINWKTTP